MLKDMQGHCGWTIGRECEREIMCDSKDSQGLDYAESGGLNLGT